MFVNVHDFNGLIIYFVGRRKEGVSLIDMCTTVFGTFRRGGSGLGAVTDCLQIIVQNFY